MTGENRKSDLVTLPHKAPQCLPISLRIKAKVLKMSQEALSDVPRVLQTSCSLCSRHTGRLAALSGPCAQSPGKEGFSPDVHLACALLPSGLYSDTTFPVRPALPLFPDTLYPLPCLIFSLPITTSHYRMYFAYLPLFVVCLFQEE